MPESWRDVALRLMSDDDQSWTQVKSKGKGNDWSGWAAKGKGKDSSWGSWDDKGKGKSKGKGKTQEAPMKGKGKDSGKGKGKDAGKGKGKDASKGKGWWPCPEEKCRNLNGKVWQNPPTQDWCGVCYVVQAATLPIWQDARAKLREENLAAAATKEEPK